MHDHTTKKDDALVELTLLGDKSAFKELVVRHERAVLGTAYKVTKNHYSAEDAAQDAFVSAWINLDSLREREKFSSWVCTIAKNRARNLVIHYRNTAADISLNLLENLELSEEDESGFAELLSNTSSGDCDRDEKLHTAVEALGEKIREAISLHYFDGLSVAQIAQKLSLPEGTVKWRLCEGRKQLRKEYGVMDKTYNETETLVQRVMRQVEELKLWQLKKDKTGFEKDYRAVLANVEELDESTEKHYALADVLIRGYWWLPGEKNREMLAKIKDCAIKSHNDEVMMSILANEDNEYKGKELIDFIKNTQIPFLEENGFVKSLAYEWFWTGHHYFVDGQTDSALEAYSKVLEILTPADVYYAAALAAIQVAKINELKCDKNERYFGRAVGEVYRFIDGKPYFWSQPGFSGGGLDDENASLLWNLSACDRLMYDPDMKCGDVRSSSDNKSTLTYKENGITISTPAGKFKNCQMWVFEGEYYGLTYAESIFCPDVGLIKQMVKRHSSENTWQLSSYEIHGGHGILPLSKGNRWNYECLQNDGTISDIENRYEIISFKNNSAVCSNYCFIKVTGYDLDSWSGNMLYARYNYYNEVSENHTIALPTSEYFERAAELAKTKRQKIHTAIASNVMKRIFETEPNANPEYTEKGRWNFFSICDTEYRNGKVFFSENNRSYAFEWKDMAKCGDEGYKILHSFLYDILSDAVGCIWNDKWIPGYHAQDKNRKYYNMTTNLTIDVYEDECVITPAGRFDNCRHISFDLNGLNGGWGYRGGKKDYYFAPNVGIVKMSSLYKDGTLENVWELTEYRGTGDGYFPVKDGLFRRYQPKTLGSGWHASVEYTFDEDDTGIVVFRNALGTQDRTNYEADKAEADNN